MGKDFKRGDRIMLSPKGQYRLGRPIRFGTVTSTKRDGVGLCVRVRWDGSKSSAYYAINFVEKVQEDAPNPGVGSE
jgi:hypothetical protein